MLQAEAIVYILCTIAAVLLLMMPVICMLIIENAYRRGRTAALAAANATVITTGSGPASVDAVTSPPPASSLSTPGTPSPRVTEGDPPPPVEPVYASMDRGRCESMAGIDGLIDQVFEDIRLRTLSRGEKEKEEEEEQHQRQRRDSGGRKTNGDDADEIRVVSAEIHAANE